MGFVATSANTFGMQGRPYSLRVCITAALMAAGLIAVAFAPNFWLALVGIVRPHHSC